MCNKQISLSDLTSSFKSLSLEELILLNNAVQRELKNTHSWFDSERPNWDGYGCYLAHAVSSRGSCLRRKAGAVLMNQANEIITTGYNGKPSKLSNCADKHCKGVTAASGTNLHDCEAVHAEVNAVLRCKDKNEIHTVYVTCSPCVACVDILLSTPAVRIVFAEEYPHNEESKRRWTEAGREWVHYQYKERLNLNE